MRRIALLIFLAVLAFQTFAQEKLVAVKFADVDNETECTPVFVERVEALLKKILEEPKKTNGFIAVSGEDSRTLIARIKIVRARIKENSELKNRIEISRPGTHYDKYWPKSEFWLIPDGAETPYHASTADCSCSTVVIQGNEKIDNITELLVFSIDYPNETWLGDPITFKWSITGGSLVKGQGTHVITVRRNRRERKEITASIEIGGTDEDCHCTTSASFTTTIIPK